MTSFFETYGMPKSRKEIIEEYQLQKSLLKVNPAAENIDHYLDLGFKKVCSVRSTRVGNYWEYTHIDESVMYDSHRSWVYVITRHGRIVKIGETGNPLGIKMSDGQPKLGTQCRLGRYRKGGGTDEDIRDMLRTETQNKLHTHAIEIYAMKCPEIDFPIKICTEDKIIKSQIHKELEKALLDYFKANIGQYPDCNAGRC
jgi:hypothetical protein